MKIRKDVADMLRAGRSQADIMRALHVGYPTVKRTREVLGLPAPVPGSRPVGPIEAEFAARTEPVDGGHLRWTGYKDADGTPKYCPGGRPQSVHRIAFRLRHGREPEGRVTTGCDMPGCIAPDHVVDKPMRAKNRALFKAIFGGAQ